MGGFLFWTFAVSVLCAACAAEPAQPSRHAAPTEQGKYRVEIRPESDSAAAGEMHAWIVGVSDEQGAHFVPDQLVFTGGMPQHKHGFVTEPRVTDALREGEFRVEGVKFHMPGRWTLLVHVVGPRGPDRATFVVDVAP